MQTHKKKKRVKKYVFAIMRLHQLQAKLKKPPKREKIQGYVDDIVKEAKMEGHILERYFRLLATCALMNRESMHRFWSGV